MTRSGSIDRQLNKPAPRKWQRGVALSMPLLLSAVLLVVAISLLRAPAHADPIPPPEGYPKLSLSLKTVTPTLASTGGETLYYEIEIRNTGAYMAQNTTLVDPIPANTTYNSDAQASAGPAPTFSAGKVRWVGNVGFDKTVVINFSVNVNSGYSGKVLNTAEISQASIPEPIIVSVESTVADSPIFTISKTAEPDKPGPNNPMTYTLVVTNVGQPVTDLSLTVTDKVPAKTSFRSVGADGTLGPGNSVIWNRPVTLSIGETSIFTFSVDVNNVLSGTVITNDKYDVNSPSTSLTAGDPFTNTVVDPEFLLLKEAWPDPPGSNREMTYTLVLLNRGSRATDIDVTDDVPAGVTYVRGGKYAGGEVSWSWPALDTGEVANFTYTVSIHDVADVPIVNDNYQACSAEGICQAGEVVTHVVNGPTFVAHAELDPIAKKPGGGGGPVTPTLTIKNLGPGYALDATAMLRFERISVQLSDVQVIPPVGTVVDGPDCGEKCRAYRWNGNVGVGQIISFTTFDGQNTIGGEEGTIYTATVQITDTLGAITTEPVSATATGKVTHFANLIPTKSAPPAIGRGQLMTYTIGVWNSALSTDEPPYPLLTDTVPTSVTLVSVSDNGASYELNGQTVVSWTLPAMSTGERLGRSYVVQVDNNLVSGTQITNSDYWTTWFELEASAFFSNTGGPVTTTVREVGLIDSYKEVTPALALPGPENTLTFYLHIVNSGPYDLQDVEVYDQLPWQYSTYQRDALATSGLIISDIVSMEWSGDVDAFSEEVVTLTVKVDPYYKGPLTNTAVISHPDLLQEVVVHAVAYITDDPVLKIGKSASPSPVLSESELLYTIRVQNLGQQATSLEITDTIPADTTYVPGSASGNGQLISDEVSWQSPVLQPGKSKFFTFKVLVERPREVVNDQYGVVSAEGTSARGAPVITPVDIQGGIIYLPVLFKQ